MFSGFAVFSTLIRNSRQNIQYSLQRNSQTFTSGFKSSFPESVGQGLISPTCGQSFFNFGFLRNMSTALISRKSFKDLQPIDLNSQESRINSIPLGPEGLVYKKLENGFTYYIKKNSKPKERAAISLAVKAGSVLENENERGVAHIVEHLAFSATKLYSNHDIVKFLESIGAEFGACQNAYTSSDETVFELFVPIDKPGHLSTAISILAEFSTEIRVSDNDLKKERGAVLEEWRQGRNAAGRMQEAYWSSLLEGTKYAERLPIGLDSLVKSVPASVVLEFYRKWYRLENMALVVVGDFNDTQAVEDLIHEHFGSKPITEGQLSSIPEFPLVPHTEPRFHVLAEKEAGGTAVMLSCKTAMTQLATVTDYRDSLVEEMFHMALNQRLNKISRQNNPPFYSASSSTINVVKPIKAFQISANCQEKGVICCTETILTELARVRKHGFTSREISRTRAMYSSHMESAYIERDQTDSSNLRDEYLQHFLREESCPGIEYEAQLAKTLIPGISAEDVSAVANNFLLSNSCVVSAIEPRKTATVSAADLRLTADKVQSLEDSQKILPWSEDDILEKIVTREPTPGEIADRVEYRDLEASEILLDNGMTVCYKATDHFDDQVLINAFAYGGLSEASRVDFRSCSLSSILVTELGPYGHKPALLSDLLMGKRVDMAFKIGTYLRAFSADCSPDDLETSLQLIHQLFCHEVKPSAQEMPFITQMLVESVMAVDRNPFSAFSQRVKEVNYGDSFYFKRDTVEDILSLDPEKACSFFNSCYRDPSAFTVVLVGKMDPETAVPLIQKYLGGIPRPEAPVMVYKREEVAPLNVQFPSSVVREDVLAEMVESQCSVQITFPIQLDAENAVEDVHWTGFMAKLIETRLLQKMRFEHGHVYSASVTPSLGRSRPSKSGTVKGELAIGFSCHPDSSSHLVDMAVREVELLQREGPTESECLSVVEIDRRAYETGQQDNTFWLERLMLAYQSRTYNGDLLLSYKAQDEARKATIEAVTPGTMQLAMSRILPFPAASNFTAVSLKPKKGIFARLLSLNDKLMPTLTPETKLILAGSSAAVAVLLVTLYLRASMA